jgi:hypothetical protein
MSSRTRYVRPLFLKIPLDVVSSGPGLGSPDSNPLIHTIVLTLASHRLFVRGGNNVCAIYQALLMSRAAANAPSLRCYRGISERSSLTFALAFVLVMGLVR